MAPLGRMEKTTLAETPRGASFVRADLHIHSYGGSYDVTDSTMTPAAIVNTAMSKGLSIISVTDHNSVANVDSAIAAARGRPILVVPGVELSTPGGHLLAYVETSEMLTRLMSALEFSDDRKACRTSAFDVLRLVEALHGFVIAAHIDLESGLEKAISGYGDPKSSVMCSKTMAAIEIGNVAALGWYTEQDTEAPRKAILKKRIETLGDPFVGVIPRVQSSDAHTLKALGRNYEQTEKLTRVKMNTLTWASLRAAFADPEARVRVEQDIPKATASFVAMRIRGGFLDKQTIGFSPNLTCIIGGRGSGKSTAFAALRAIAGTPPPDELGSSEAWPDEVDVVYTDEFGAETIIRLNGNEISNLSAPGEAVPHIAIESLAQGEMARTIEKCGEDPQALLGFLDELVDLRELREQAEQAQNALISNGVTRSTLAKDKGSLEPTQNLLKTKEVLQETAKREKGAELIDLQNSVATSIQLRQRLLPDFKGFIADVKAALAVDLLNDLSQLADDSTALGTPDKPSPIPELVGRLTAILQDTTRALNEELQRGTLEINRFTNECQAIQQKRSYELKARADALLAQGVPLDLKALTTLAETIRSLTVKVTKLKRQQAEWQTATTERAKLLSDYVAAQARVTTERNRLAFRLSGAFNRSAQHHDVSRLAEESGDECRFPGEACVQTRELNFGGAGALVRR